MPIINKKCNYCNKSFLACRKDNIYCGQKCNQASFRENGKFKYPILPKSGVKYIRFDRYTDKWEIIYKRKYYGEFKELEDAKKRLAEIVGNQTK
jgi:hypothetical protein